MNQYNNHLGQTGRGRKNNRYDSGRSEFLDLLLFYILPFILVNLIIFLLVTTVPKAAVTLEDTEDYVSTTMELKVTTFLPTKEPVVTLDGTPVELQKTGRKTYSATLNRNGNLEVKLAGIGLNKIMTNTVFYAVNILDDTPPAIYDEIIEDGILSFRLEDSQSKVDYSSVHASTEEQEEILPLTIDRSTGTVTFEFPSQGMTISAKDTIGNELLVTINPNGKKVDENGEEIDDEDESEPVSAEGGTAAQ